MKTKPKKLSYYFLSLFFILSMITGFCMPYSNIVLAAETSSTVETSYIYDEPGKLTEDEITRLNNEIASSSENAGIDFYILITEDLEGKNLITYMEDFADEHTFTNTALLCISFDEPRSFEIQGYGTAEHYLTYDRINSIFDDMQNDLKNGNYYKACSTFISRSTDYMLTEPANSRLISLPIQLVIALVVALVIVLPMVLNAGGKITTTASTYLDETHSRLLAKRDRYVRTSVTKHKIEKSSSGHHSGSGTSSGGRSHSGGGGRSF